MTAPLGIGDSAKPFTERELADFVAGGNHNMWEERLLATIAARDAEIVRLTEAKRIYIPDADKLLADGFVQDALKKLNVAEARAATMRAATIEECAKVLERRAESVRADYRAANGEVGYSFAAAVLDSVSGTLRALAPPAAVAPPEPMKVPSTETVPVFHPAVEGGTRPVGYVTTTREFHAEPSREQATCETCGGTGWLEENLPMGEDGRYACHACAPKPEARREAVEADFEQRHGRLLGALDEAIAQRDKAEKERDEARERVRGLEAVARAVVASVHDDIETGSGNWVAVLACRIEEMRSLLTAKESA